MTIGKAVSIAVGVLALGAAIVSVATVIATQNTEVATIKNGNEKTVAEVSVVKSEFHAAKIEAAKVHEEIKIAATRTIEIQKQLIRAVGKINETIDARQKREAAEKRERLEKIIEEQREELKRHRKLKSESVRPR